MTDDQQAAAQEAAPEPTPESTPEAEAEAPQVTEEEGQDPPAEEEDKSPSKERRERRKAQMQKLRDDAQEARQALAEQNERLSQARALDQTTTAPKEADFDDYNAYLVAMGSFHAAQTMNERSSREIEETQQATRKQIADLHRAQQAELARGWADQVADAKDRYTDFDEVVYTAPISDNVAQIVATSDAGADVAYFLGTNADQARAISQMHPLEAARAIGRIEAQLSLPKPKTVSSTPDPVNPVRATSITVKNPSKMSNAEYRAAREAGQI